jgi:hypothetical protein
MPLRMQALGHWQTLVEMRSSLKCFEASVTIAVGGMDIDVGLFVNLRAFIEDECTVGLCSVEFSGGVWMHKYFQMVVKGNFCSLSVLDKKLKVCLGWDESPPMGHVVTSKRLRDEGLHTFLSMVDYYMKDNRGKHFEFAHHDVIADDTNEGKMKYAKFGKVGLNNHVSLLHNNVLQSAHQ